MYAAIPEKVRQRLQRKHGQRRRGKTPLNVLREQAARRRLQAYQYGAYDSAESTAQYETGEQFFGALQEELQKEFFPVRAGARYNLPSHWLGSGDEGTMMQLRQQQFQFGERGYDGAWDDDLAAGGLGLKIKLRLPKFIRKMKPLKVLGKVAKIAAPVVGVATGGVLLPAAIGAGGAILRKGKRVKLFKDVAGSAAVGAAGGVARRVAPTAFRFLKKVPGKISRLWKNKQTGQVVQGDATPPSRMPGWEVIPDVSVSAGPLPSDLQIPQSVQDVAAAVGLPMPTYQPTETAAAYTPPGEEVPGTTDTTVPGAAQPMDAKKLLLPALLAAAFLL